MKNSEVLRKARGLIDRPEKWCKYETTNDNGQHCLLGAVNIAVNGIEEYTNTSRGLARAFFPRVGACIIESGLGPLHGVAEWNNAPERTHADVMQAFDRAIALAEKEELNAAPQATTAIQTPASSPNHEGVGQGEFAVAAPAFQRFMERITTGQSQDVATVK